MDSLYQSLEVLCSFLLLSWILIGMIPASLSQIQLIVVQQVHTVRLASCIVL